MIMKSILSYLAILTLSFNVFALEVQEKPKIATNGQMSSYETMAMNQDNSPGTVLATPIVNSHTIPQALTEKPSEFITALCVYLIIIIVYSVYGLKANSKNARN